MYIIELAIDNSSFSLNKIHVARMLGIFLPILVEIYQDASVAKLLIHIVEISRNNEGN